MGPSRVPRAQGSRGDAAGGLGASRHPWETSDLLARRGGICRSRRKARKHLRFHASRCFSPRGCCDGNALTVQSARRCHRTAAGGPPPARAPAPRAWRMRGHGWVGAGPVGSARPATGRRRAGCGRRGSLPAQLSRDLKCLWAWVRDRPCPARREPCPGNAGTQAS